MNVEIWTEAAQIPFQGIFVSIFRYCLFAVQYMKALRHAAVREMYRQVDRHTDRSAGVQTGRQAYRQVGRRTDRSAGVQTGRQEYRQVGRRKDRSEGVQTVRRTLRQQRVSERSKGHVIMCTCTPI
jgi:hypothetical protein